MVLGSRGLSRITGFLIGSVGMATISGTERPVILVRAAERPDNGPPPVRTNPYRDVVASVDVDQPRDALLAFAFNEAARRLRAAHRARLVTPLSSRLGSPARSGSPPGDGRGGRPRACRTSDALAAEVPVGGVVQQALVGSPGDQLVHCAVDADLVVISRRIRKSPLGAHIGPITHAVIHHAPAPVAVVAHN